MKKLVFSLILSIILCTTWILYVNYNHKRFVEDLRIKSSSITQSTNTPDTSDASENGETVAANVIPSETVLENTPITGKQTKADTVLQEKPPLIEAESSRPTIAEDGFGDFPVSQGITKEREKRSEILPKQLQRLRNNPTNWVDGNPNLILLTNGDLDTKTREFLNTNGTMLTNLDQETLEKIRTSFQRILQTLSKTGYIKPMDSELKIRQNEDGTWSFIQETIRAPTQ